MQMFVILPVEGGAIVMSIGLLTTTTMGELAKIDRSELQIEHLEVVQRDISRSGTLTIEVCGGQKV